MVFKLVAVVGPALVAALVAGDIVASEHAGGTLKTILVRSLRRWHVLAGKAFAVVTYLAAALAVYAVVGIGAGVIAWGFDPVTNLSGQSLSAAHAFGLFLSVVTRNSVAAVAGTLLYALALQGLAALSAIAAARPFLLVSQLSAWHDLFQTPTAGGAIVRSLWVSAAFAVPPLVAVLVVFNRRDVTT